MKDTRSDAELNRIIAEWCGWKYNGMGTVGSLHHPTNCTCFNGAGCSIPDYCTDLNAAHEAEKNLSREEFVDYCAFKLRYFTGEGTVTDYKMITSTARQRAEALVAVIEAGRRLTGADCWI